MTMAKKLEQIAQNEQKIYDKGLSDGYNTFWDTYQFTKDENGNPKLREDYSFAFAGPGWKDKIFIPKHKIEKITNATQMFCKSEIKELYTKLFSAENLPDDYKPRFDLRECKDLTDMFRDSQITHIPSLIFPENRGLINTFCNANKLHTIESLELHNNEFSKNAFGWCAALANINEIKGNFIGNIDFSSCGQLTKASIENIVNALSDKISGKTLTLSTNAVHWAFAEYNDEIDVVKLDELIVSSNESEVKLELDPDKTIDSPKNILISFKYNPANYPTEFSDNTFLTITCNRPNSPKTYKYTANEIFKAGGVGYIGIYNSHITNITITNECKFSGKLEEIRVGTVNPGDIYHSEKLKDLLDSKSKWSFAGIKR